MGTSGKERVTPFSTSLQANTHHIHSRLGQSSDLVIRLFQSDAAPERELALLYIEGMTDAEMVNKSVLEPLMSLRLPQAAATEGAGLLEALRTHVIAVGEVKDADNIEEAIQHMTDGMCMILAGGSSFALLACVAGYGSRSVDVPQTQTVIRGPQRGFVEDIFINIGLVRQIVRSPHLYVQTHKIGKQTHTSVSVLHMHGIADEGIVKEVYRRLAEIDIDGVLDSGYVEEFIQDETFTMFPTLLNTERPDAAAAALLEGRTVVLVDGSPFALIAPASFFSFFQSPEDYYQRFDIASFIRVIRYAAYVVSLLLPSLYIAVTTFHQEMLPTMLLISLAAQREGVPLPGLLEALMMELTFEVLREAGVRMPRAIGPAISIVGALVLGQAAVQAGIVSAGIVIVVSFTAISNFVIPSYAMAATSRLIRFGLMLMAGLLGFFGIFVAGLCILIHLASLRSFGVPYMSPLAPNPDKQWALRDIFFRIPWWAAKHRPFDMKLPNPSRMRTRGNPRSRHHRDKS